MVEVRRVEHRFEYYVGFDEDVAKLTAWYEIEGHDKRLEVSTYIDHRLLDDDEAKWKAWCLEQTDSEAQWAADHPDNVPTYSPKLVCVD